MSKAKHTIYGDGGVLGKTYLYIMTIEPYENVDIEYAKIGISNNPIARRQWVQTGNPFKVTLSVIVAGWKNRNKALFMEREVHNMLYCHRIRNEWFEFSCYGQLEYACPILDIGKWLWWDGKEDNK